MSLRRRLLAVIVAVNLLVMAALAVLLSLDSLDRRRQEDRRRQALLEEASRQFQRLFAGTLGLILEPSTPVRELLLWAGWSTLEDAQVMKREYALDVDTIYLNPLGARSHGTGFQGAEVKEALNQAIRVREPVYPASGVGVAFPVYIGGRPDSGVWGSVYAVPRLGRDLPGPPPVRVLEILLMLALGMALLAGAGFVLVARQLVRPIEGLAGAFRRVAAGDLETKVPPSGRDDELDLLVRSFNAMAADLGEFRRDLEGRVQAALEKAQAAEHHLVIAQRLASTGRLASGIAHEINNPLGGMINIVRTLRTREVDPEKRREYLDLVQSGLERIQGTVRAILQFAPRQVQPQVVEVGPVLDRALALAEHGAREAGVRLERRGLADGLRVFGDAGELQQVFLNLLLNAVDAVEPGGWVRVGAEASGGQARVWVADNGCGMTEEERAQAFDAFYTTKPVGEGSGLGLFIAYSIVANHGGRLEVVSRKGEGSTFTVVLPQAAPGGAPRSAGA